MSQNRLFYFLTLITLTILIYLFISFNWNFQVSNLKGKKDGEIFSKLTNKRDYSQNSNSDLNLFHRFNQTFYDMFQRKSLQDSIILMKTFKFMINDVDEYDPELIDFVRSLIKPPSKLPLNLDINNGLDYSQFGESKYINEVFKNKTKGFFVESGGHDGEQYSNSLFFEKYLNWTGLLIEPVTDSFNKLIRKNRNIFSLNACLGNRKVFVAKFKVLNVFSGREEQLGSNQDHYFDGRFGNFVYDYYPCFSINTILAAIGVSKVDLFSLDIQGGEWDVIQSIDYNKLNIDLFCIEQVVLGQDKQKISNHLIKNGYYFLSEIHFNYYFRKY